MPSDAAQAAPAPAALPKKTRRQLNKELRQAARDRRQITEYANRRNPPSDNDIWICEFCEYEAIFKEPPRALIRKYELKDRRLRKEAAERQRLLEKAKMKSRKGKKNSKPGSAKNTTAAALDRTTPQGDAAVPPPPPVQDQGLEDEEYYEEDGGYGEGEQETGSPNETDTAGRAGYQGGGGTEHRPLRPPSGAHPNPNNHAITANS